MTLAFAGIGIISFVAIIARFISRSASREFSPKRVE